MKKTKKGFTLVELMVVIAILAILATVSVVGYTSFIKKAEQSNAVTELKQVATYVDAETSTGNKLVVGELSAATDGGTGALYAFTSEGLVTVQFAAKKVGESSFEWEEVATGSATVTAPTDWTVAIKALSADFEKLEGTFTVDTTNSVVTYTSKNNADAKATWTVGTFEVK